MTVDASQEQATPITSIRNTRPTRRPTDVGIPTLAASMAIEGQRHPILVMPNGELLKGRRRVMAARELGWTSIATRQIRTVEEAVEAIYDSRDELNHPREIEEWVDLGAAIETLDHTPQADGQDKRDYVGYIGGAVSASGSAYKRSRVLVTAARSKMRPRHVVDVAKASLDAYKAGTLTLSAAYNRVRAAEAANPVDVVAPEDNLPLTAPPSPMARSPRARKVREDWVRALASEGATSDQIAGRLAITVAAVKKIAKDIGVQISADHATGRSQRRPADPNRAMRVVADDLDALVWSLGRIDVTALDEEHLAGYAAQFATYARAITRVAKRIKGVSQ